MQIDVIIQARMGATRLPGKVLKKLNGKTILQRVIERTSKTKSVKKVIVATTENPNDEKIVKFCRKNNILYFRGSEKNVLDRYAKAVEHFKSQIVIRATADNPFFDPVVTEKLIRKHIREKNDYTFSTGFPLGSSCEIFSTKALIKVNMKATNPIHKEHIGTYFLDHPKKFRIGCLKAPKSLRKPELRLTIDTPDDFKTANNILKKLKDDFMLEEVIFATDQNPSLLKNKHIQQVYPTKKIKQVFSGKNPLSKSAN